MSWTMTKEVFGVLGGEGLPRLESPSLRLEKLLFMKKRQDNKEKQIDAVVKCHNAHAMFPIISFADIPCVRRFVMRLGGRLLVNHAGGILENTGLCLHRHFGCPIIPGSALKGMARHYAWGEWAESDSEKKRRDSALALALTFGFPTGDKPGRKEPPRSSKNEYLDLYLAAEFPDLFGGSSSRLSTLGGTVCFLPAFPVSSTSTRPKLVKDITTCHHRNYYSGRQKMPYDSEEPNVLPFPAVEKGAVFEFSLKPSLKADAVVDAARDLLEDFEPLAFAERCLRGALSDFGAGAKTSAGYGWFFNDSAVDKEIEDKREHELDVERERQELEKRQKQRDMELAQMTPQQRRVEELGILSDDDFKALLRTAASAGEEEQKAIIEAVMKHKIHIWIQDRNGKKKAAIRAEAIRLLATKFGVSLP